MTDSKLDITLQNPTGESESFWMSVEAEPKESVGATLTQVADTIDALYSIDPCDSESTTPSTGGSELDPVDLYVTDAVLASFGETSAFVSPEVPEIFHKNLNMPRCSETQDALDAGADAVSNQVKPSSVGGYTLKYGDYEAKIRIRRSHVCEDYTTSLTVGSVISKSRTRKKITVSIQVGGYSAQLEYPPAQNCSSNNLIDTAIVSNSTILKFLGSTVHFKNYTETATITYTAEYDVLTVLIPNENGRQVGSVLFCEYMGLTGEIEITPPSHDSSGSDTDSGSTDTNNNSTKTPCWNFGSTTINGGGGDGDEDDDGGGGDGEGKDEPTDEGCTGGFELEDPATYEMLCCKPGNGSCGTSSKVWRGGAGKSKNLDRFKDSDGKVLENYVLIGVAPEDGICGEHITTQVVGGNCCEDIEPLSVMEDQTSATITLGGRAVVQLTGGQRPITWSVNAGYSLSEETSTGRNTIIMDEEGSCTSARVSANDGCSGIAVVIEFDDDRGISVSPANIVVEPGGVIGVSAYGGLAPYTFSADRLEKISSGDSGANFRAPDDFCGADTITATDSCGNSGESNVNATSGYWKPVDEWDACNPPGSGSYVYDTWPVAYTGQYRASVRSFAANSSPLPYCPEVDCPLGDHIVPDPSGHSPCLPGWIHTNGCCFDGNNRYFGFYQRALSLFEWSCPDE